jgi:hypothetical protein
MVTKALGTTRVMLTKKANQSLSSVKRSTIPYKAGHATDVSFPGEWHNQDGRLFYGAPVPDWEMDDVYLGSSAAVLGLGIRLSSSSIGFAITRSVLPFFGVAFPSPFETSDTSLFLLRLCNHDTPQH